MPVCSSQDTCCSTLLYLLSNSCNYRWVWCLPSQVVLSLFPGYKDYAGKAVVYLDRKANRSLRSWSRGIDLLVRSSRQPPGQSKTVLYSFSHTLFHLVFSSPQKMGLLPLLVGDYNRLIHLTVKKFFMMFSVNYFTDEIYLMSGSSLNFHFLNFIPLLLVISLVPI